MPEISFENELPEGDGEAPASSPILLHPAARETGAGGAGAGLAPIGAGPDAIPHSAESEEALLGALIADPAAFALVDGRVKPGHFWHYKLGLVYAAFEALRARGEGGGFDKVLVYEEARAQGHGVEVTLDYLDALYTQVARRAPATSSVEAYAGRMLRSYGQRSYLQLSARIAELARRPDLSLEAVASAIQSELAAISRAHVSGRYVPLAQMLDEYWQMTELMRTNPYRYKGIPSGSDSLDEITGGWQRGDLIIVGGRPGSGKSALTSWFAREAVRTARVDDDGAMSARTVVVESLEMARSQITNRLLAVESRVDSKQVRDRTLSPDEVAALHEADAALRPLSIWTNDVAGKKVSDIRSSALRLREEVGLDMLIIDYIQLVQPDVRSRSGNKVDEYDAVAQGLKELAKELDIPVIALAQLTKAGEFRADPVPVLGDLKGSGGIIAAPDLIIFIDREEMRDHSSPRAGLADLYIAKHRDGPLGQVTLRFDKTTTGFADESAPGLAPDWTYS